MRTARKRGCAIAKAIRMIVPDEPKPGAADIVIRRIAAHAQNVKRIGLASVDRQTARELRFRQSENFGDAGKIGMLGGVERPVYARNIHKNIQHVFQHAGPGAIAPGELAGVAFEAMDSLLGQPKQRPGGGFIRRPQADRHGEGLKLICRGRPIGARHLRRQADDRSGKTLIVRIGRAPLWERRLGSRKEPVAKRRDLRPEHHGSTLAQGFQPRHRRAIQSPPRIWVHDRAMEPKLSFLDSAAQTVGLSALQALLTPLAIAFALWGMGRLLLALGRKAWAGATEHKGVNLALGMVGLILAIGLGFVSFAIVPGPLGFPQLASMR